MKIKSRDLKYLLCISIFKNTNIKLLTLLILTDLCFIVLHFIHYRFQFLGDVKWSVTEDRGYGEIFQYIKVVWIITALFLYFIRTSTVLYFTWSILFIYLLLDDALQFHEKIGSNLAGFLNFHPAFNLRAHDFGEMIVYITVGVFFLLALLFSYSKSDLTARKISNNLLFLLAILTFFGFFIDMLRNIICNLFKVNSDSNLISIFSDILEDGGEMLAISLTAWYVLIVSPGLDQDGLGA